MTEEERIFKGVLFCPGDNGLRAIKLRSHNLSSLYSRRDEVSAHHVQRAVGQIDAVHDPENERQPGREQEEHEAELEPVEGLFEDQLGHRYGKVPPAAANDVLASVLVTSTCTGRHRHRHGC